MRSHLAYRVRNVRLGHDRQAHEASRNLAERFLGLFTSRFFVLPRSEPDIGAARRRRLHVEMAYELAEGKLCNVSNLYLTLTTLKIREESKSEW